MPAESSMIRRLREWKRVEAEKALELVYWKAQVARQHQNAYHGLMGWQAVAAMQQATMIAGMWEAQAEAKLAALGSRTETKPSPLSSLGSLLG